VSSAAPKAPKAAKAREILEWCRSAHEKMRGNPTGLDWVLIWAATIALLRAVGHALAKEDAASDDHLKKEQESWWGGLKKTKPDPHIFWEFIDSDRNLLLKEATLTVTQGIHVGVQEVACASESVSASDSFSAPSQPEQRSPPCPTHSDPSPTTYSYHMKSGFFAEQDPRDLVRKAIEWWEKQLSDIEQKAATS
jgi:hypothetical protein